MNNSISKPLPKYWEKNCVFFARIQLTLFSVRITNNFHNKDMYLDEHYSLYVVLENTFKHFIYIFQCLISICSCFFSLKKSYVGCRPMLNIYFNGTSSALFCSYFCHILPRIWSFCRKLWGKNQLSNLKKCKGINLKSFFHLIEKRTHMTLFSECYPSCNQRMKAAFEMLVS